MWEKDNYIKGKQMNIFNKDTSEVAVDIIRNYLEFNIQPVMLEIDDEGFLKTAEIHNSDEYHDTWMFVSSFKNKRYCSYWELEDTLADYGLEMKLVAGEEAQIIIKEETSEETLDLVA